MEHNKGINYIGPCLFGLGVGLVLYFVAPQFVGNAAVCHNLGLIVGGLSLLGAVLYLAFGRSKPVKTTRTNVTQDAAGNAAQSKSTVEQRPL